MRTRSKTKPDSHAELSSKATTAADAANGENAPPNGKATITRARGALKAVEPPVEREEPLLGSSAPHDRGLWRLELEHEGVGV